MKWETIIYEYSVKIESIVQQRMVEEESFNLDLSLLLSPVQWKMIFYMLTKKIIYTMHKYNCQTQIQLIEQRGNNSVPNVVLSIIAH